MLKAIFWVSIALIAYIYLGYPLLAWILARLIGCPVSRSPMLPKVTVLIAAHNEARYISETVRNKLSQDYPPDLLDVIVVSDDSTDGTDEIVKALGSRVKLIRQSPRGGKTAALNQAIGHARGDILVFSDANSIYAMDAIRNLVESFADPEVGYVTGKMVYVKEDGSLVGDGCSAYMRYENWLRAQETRLAAVIGVDGGIDAIRKALYQEMRPDQLPDFVLPLKVAARGYRVVYESRATLKEFALADNEAEYRMRVRVGLRALWALSDMRALLNPMRYPLLALQLISHKLLRYLAFIPLALALLTGLILGSAGGFYAVAAISQLLIYILAGLGWVGFGSTLPIIWIPYYFVLLNVATAHAAVRFARRERQTIWKPRAG